jgi:hypothetical protein
MYLVCVEQRARDEIGAAAAVHAELGREYDQAVAESLVDRIGAEIDRRVDAKLAQPPARQMMAKRGYPSGSVALALGSTIVGAITSVSILANAENSGPAPNSLVLLIVIIWVAIGAINVSYNRSR